MKELNIEAKTENLDQVIEFVKECLGQYDCSDRILTQLIIAIEEIFVNVAHYAYGQEEGRATVRIEIKKNPLSVVISFLDNGVQYNPLEKPDPDITLSAEQRQIGGLGIFMVKKSMDAVAYEYKEGQNILTITKKF